MKFIAFAALLAASIFGCTSAPKDANFPVDSLFHFANRDSLLRNMRDSAIGYNWNTILFKGTAQEIQLNTQEPWQIHLNANARNLKPSGATHIPKRWQTRDGVYAWIPLDSLQAINGKPFYISYRDTVFNVENWEGGKLANSNLDVELVLEGGGDPPPYMSSQEAIDKKLKVRARKLKLWRTNWPKMKLAATNGIPGDFPAGSTKALTDNDLKDAGYHDLRIMRNEIFARHQYKFKSEDLQEHFKYERWYSGTNDNVDAQLTDIEKKNVQFIVEREQSRYANRPITAMIKQLPLLELPLNVAGDFDTIVPIPFDIEDPDGNVLGDTYADRVDLQLYGLLPDTSKFYAVVWQGANGASYVGAISGPHLTVFDKKFRWLGGIALEAHTDNLEYAQGDCNAEESQTSVINKDYSFESTYTAIVTCAGDDENEESEPRVTTLKGKISKDGIIIIKR